MQFGSQQLIFVLGSSLANLLLLGLVMRCRHYPHSLSTKATESQERGELSGLDESIGSRELTVELDQIFSEVVLDGGVGDVS